MSWSTLLFDILCWLCFMNFQNCSVLTQRELTLTLTQHYWPKTSTRQYYAILTVVRGPVSSLLVWAESQCYKWIRRQGNQTFKVWSGAVDTSWHWQAKAQGIDLIYYLWQVPLPVTSPSHFSPVRIYLNSLKWRCLSLLMCFYTVCLDGALVLLWGCLDRRSGKNSMM